MDRHQRIKAALQRELSKIIQKEGTKSAFGWAVGSFVVFVIVTLLAGLLLRSWQPSTLPIIHYYAS